jgi:hypothetical protein
MNSRLITQVEDASKCNFVKFCGCRQMFLVIVHQATLTHFMASTSSEEDQNMKEVA